MNNLKTFESYHKVNEVVDREFFSGVENFMKTPIFKKCEKELEMIFSDLKKEFDAWSGEHEDDDEEFMTNFEDVVDMLVYKYLEPKTISEY